MMFQRLAAAVVVGFAAAPLSAQCLTEGDLGRGVVVRYENGDFTTMRRMADGYQEVEEHYASGDPTMRFRAHRGVYFVEETQLLPGGTPDPSSRLEINFETDPARLPDPLPGVTWEGPTVNVFADGGTRNEVASVRFGTAPDLTFGECSYTAVSTDIRYDWGADGGLQLGYLYLPEVGTALLISNQFDGDERHTTTPVALELMSK